MNITGFPACCGAHILYNLGSMENKEIIFSQLDQQIAISKNSRVGVVLAITNIEQLPIGKFLQEYGFKKTRVFPNPHNMLMELTLWSYDTTTVRQKVYSKLLKPMMLLAGFLDRWDTRRRLRSEEEH